VIKNTTVIHKYAGRLTYYFIKLALSISQ